ncbi:MAG TPA: energy transducer TonB, partial [Bryobacteraceae bacterium]|nr:energy transducer TonB [Bryobacteraceae bacterium]
ARRLKIEGEVVLQVVLTAAGEVRVVKVVRGLGHGLNENALLAASAIRFRPAHTRGEPVDSIATVRMNFQLAY